MDGARTLADARAALRQDGAVVLRAPKAAGVMTIVAGVAVLVVSVLLLVSGVLQFSWGDPEAWWPTTLGGAGIVFCIVGLIATRRARAERARVVLDASAITINGRAIPWQGITRTRAIRIGPAVGKRGPKERAILELDADAAEAWQSAGGAMTVPRGGARKIAEYGIDVPDLELAPRDVLTLIDEQRAA